MTAFQRDLYIRILATGAASSLGTLVAWLTDTSYWWAVALAAVVTVVRGLLTSVGGGAGIPSVSLLERTGWTIIQVALAAIPVAGIGIPAVLLPIAATVLATLKGLVAKHIGSPSNAATLPYRLAA